MKTKVTVSKKTESIEKVEMEIEFPCYRRCKSGFLYKFNSMKDCIWIMNSGSSDSFMVSRTKFPDESHLFDEHITAEEFNKALWSIIANLTNEVGGNV